MGGLSYRSSSPPTPSLAPQVFEEEDPVPILFLDDDLSDLSAGIDSSSPPGSPSFNSDDNMGQYMSITSFPPLNIGLSAFSTRKKTSPKTAMKSSSALVKSSGSTTSTGGKIKKIVRFLEQVEFLPSSGPSFTPHYTYDDEEDDAGFRQSNKKQRTRSPTNDYDNIRDDPAINSGLGRAGSPNRSPNRSPNGSSKHLPMPVIEVDNEYLSPPQEYYFSYSPPSPPPSWRIPPSSLIGRQPHVQESPRVRSPRQEGEEIDLMAHGDKTARDSGIYMEYSDDSDSENHNGQLPSPPSSPHPPTIHPVIARKMWPHGEIRFEDQWGRRLVPAENRDSFRFDLWPVEEDVNGEGVGANTKGAWVGRFRGMSRD